ncbi:MAG: hypothetical protein ACLRT5_09490 [Lachnospiraceae bacterium]
MAASKYTPEEIRGVRPEGENPCEGTLRRPELGTVRESCRRL